VKKHSAQPLALLLVALALPAAAQRKPGNPIEQLPANIEVLTHFGERADISPDDRRIAFMTKSFGDAMVIDLETRVIRCLTCGIQRSGGHLSRWAVHVRRIRSAGRDSWRAAG